MARDTKAAAGLAASTADGRDAERRTRTLGSVRLMRHDTKARILVPRPTCDPNDPLNWHVPMSRRGPRACPVGGRLLTPNARPKWQKRYTAAVLCAALTMCNFLAAGPTIAIVQTAHDFFPDAVASRTLMASAVARVAYLFTTTSLLQGTGSLVWVPLANKWGRRPVYVASYLLYFATAVWLVFEQTYAGFLAGRILMGLGAGAAETVAPMSIADMFFLHERGAIMSAYTCFLSVGVAAGLIVSGLVTINHGWRTIYEVGAALVGLVLVLILFTFPETAYPRDRCSPKGEKAASHVEAKEEVGAATQPAARRERYAQSLRIFRKTLTDEKLSRMAVRPFGLVLLPPVLWAALVEAATIGFLVAVTSNVDPAFQQAYGFQPYQVGLCFFAAVVGSLLGLPAGGVLGDGVADYLTKRNGGIREPEMRLPAIAISCVTSPLALVLFGVGIQHRLHWICPAIGLGLCTLSGADTTTGMLRAGIALTGALQSTFPSRRRPTYASST